MIFTLPFVPHLSPLQASEHCEDQHQWHIKGVFAMRWNIDEEDRSLDRAAFYLEILVEYEVSVHPTPPGVQP